jgi:hypothetical protein
MPIGALSLISRPAYDGNMLNESPRSKPLLTTIAAMLCVMAAVLCIYLSVINYFAGPIIRFHENHGAPASRWPSHDPARSDNSRAADRRDLGIASTPAVEKR